MKSFAIALAASAHTADAFPFMRILTHLGWKENIFQCKFPKAFRDFNVAGLEGQWHQVATNWGESTYACLTYNFILDDDKSDNFWLNVNWTKIRSPVLPQERGQYAAKYSLRAYETGKLGEKDFLEMFKPWMQLPIYSWVLATDYETYLVEYSCQQAYLDFVTIDYVSIYTRDPAAYASIEDSLKQQIKAKLPRVNTDKIVATGTGVCEIEKWWGFLPYTGII